MKKALIRKQAKPNPKGAKGKGNSFGKSKNSFKNNEPKDYNDKNDY
jgi:hypothetical protein